MSDALFIAPRAGAPSIPRQILCVEREIELRRSAYPVLVRHRRMRKKTMEREIALMLAVLETLRRVKDGAS